MPTSPAPASGVLVEFMHSDRPVLAWVLEESSGRLRIFTVNRREMKLPAARVLPWTGPALSADADRSEMERALDEHQARREKLALELDVAEIWELAQGEVDKARPEWFAGLLWEAPDPDRMAALGRAMLASKAWFKYHPPEFTVYSAEEVERRQEAEQAKREMELLSTAGNELFKALWDRSQYGKKCDLPDLDQGVAERLARMLRTRLRDPDGAEDREVWRAACKGLPEHPCLALLLAQAWGVVAPHHNHFLDEAGYEPGDEWAAEHNEEVERILASFQAADKDPMETGFVSIDASTTRDMDDAFLVERTGDGGRRVQVALALPVLFWDFDSGLDRAVAERATSLYLPEQASHMLPEAVGVELFSLHQGSPKPALVVDVTLDDQARPVSTDIRQSWVEVAENLTYHQAQERIANEPDSMVALAREVAGKLFERRLLAGAVVIQREDPEIALAPREEGDVLVDIREKDEAEEASLVVSEFMILANRAAALWARERGVPLIHRTMDADIPEEHHGVWAEPEDIYRAVRALAPSILEPEPGPHASLAAEAYATLTSPLRRYADFLNAAQIWSFLQTGAPRLDRRELEELLPALSARLQAVGRIQRFRPRYWKLLWLARTEEPVEAVVVDAKGKLVSFSLPLIQIYVRAPKAMLDSPPSPGDRYMLRFKRVDPLTNEIKVLEALEDEERARG